MTIVYKVKIFADDMISMQKNPKEHTHTQTTGNIKWIQGQCIKINYFVHLASIDASCHQFESKIIKRTPYIMATKTKNT